MSMPARKEKTRRTGSLMLGACLLSLVASGAMSGCSSLSGQGSTTPTPPSQYFDAGKQVQEKAAADHMSAVLAQQRAATAAHLPAGLLRMGSPPAGDKLPQAEK